jgi:hypothetical protein
MLIGMLFRGLLGNLTEIKHMEEISKIFTRNTYLPPGLHTRNSENVISLATSENSGALLAQ